MRGQTNLLLSAVFIFSFILLLSNVSAATPTVDSVFLNSTSAYNYSFANLTGYTVVSDGDGDNITEIYNWYKNDTLVGTTLLPDGLVAYYPFDNDLYDYFASADATAVNQASINPSSGQKSGSVEFDGDEDRLTVPAGDVTDIAGNLSISVWFKSSDTKPYQVMVHSRNEVARKGYSLKLINGQKLRFMTNRSDGLDDYRAFADDATLGEWHHAFVSYDHDGTDTKIYLDGVEVTPFVYDSYPFGIRTELQIGTDYLTSAAEFNGSLDELQIYNKTFTEAEILSLYDATKKEKQILSEDTTSGDIWKLGVKAADSTTTSAETNSSTVTIQATPTITLDSFLREQIVIQRNLTTNNATIRIEGTYDNTYTGEINYTINGVAYSDMEENNGVFSKNVTLPVGSYNITVYFTEIPGVIDSVNRIRVGDIIVVAGQSNARLSYWAAGLDPYYTTTATYPISYSTVNAYDGTNWTYYTTMTSASASNQWLPLMDSISSTQNVPVMFVSTVIGGTDVECWANTSYTSSGQAQCFIGLLHQLENLTYDNEVYGVIYYQGESDGSDTNYKSDWQTFLTNLKSEVTIVSEKIILGNTWANNIVPYYPQKATQEIWIENILDWVRIGSYVYDMNTTNLSGTVHFANISVEGWPFINRWKTAGLYNLYGEGDMKIPQLVGVYKITGTRIDMIYDRSISISDFLGNSGSTAWGLQLYSSSSGDFWRNSTWNMSHVSSTSISGSTVSYYFTEDISGADQYSYCINSYCNNETVIRDSTASFPSAFPALQVFPTAFDIEASTAITNSILRVLIGLLAIIVMFASIGIFYVHIKSNFESMNAKDFITATVSLLIVLILSIALMEYIATLV